MSKNIIITCGTSILNSKIINNGLEKKIDEIENQDTCDLDKNFVEYFSENEYEILKSQNKTIHYGAEINLMKKVYEKGDTLYFFFSETHGGEIVKQILTGYLETPYAKALLDDENLSIHDIHFITISGYKIDDPTSFKDIAIKNFYQKLDTIKSNGNETIMCPIGGYKALIPYASLYAMVYGWNIKYLYEDSNTLIDLPSGALTILSGDLLFGNRIDYSIFTNDNLSINYSFSQGLKLIYWVKNFIEYGKSRDLSYICEELKNIFIKNKIFNDEKKCLGDLEKYLINLSDAFDLIRINDITKNLDKIKNINTDTLNDQLLKNCIQFLQNEIEKIDIDVIVKWYYERGRYSETILIMREGIIDFVGKKLAIPFKERNDRLKIENTLQIQEYKTKEENRNYVTEKQESEILELFQGKEKFFEELTKKRNNFAHINNDTTLHTMKKGIDDLYKEYLEIIK